MQLSFLISDAGYVPTVLETEAKVYFEDGAIPKIELELVGDVPEMTQVVFETLALKAKEICPISKLLNAEISLKMELSKDFTN